jgi:hypothetical protein
MRVSGRTGDFKREGLEVSSECGKLLEEGVLDLAAFNFQQFPAICRALPEVQACGADREPCEGSCSC